MKRLYYIFGLSALLLSSCNYFEYDNYEAPNSGLEGTVVDRKTNESLQAEAANSYKVEYYELSWEEAGHANTQSRFFWGKADGTFLNTKIFAGNIGLLERRRILRSRTGSRVLKENRLTRLDYSVIPYARVNIDEITLTGSKQNNLEIKYTIEDTEKEVNTEGLDEGLYTLSEAQVFISSKSPNVGVNNSETKYTIRAKKEFERGDYEPGVPFQVVEKNVRNLDPGKYWVRIGVRTANPQKRYNFSTIKEIVVPAQTVEK